MWCVCIWIEEVMRRVCVVGRSIHLSLYIHGSSVVSPGRVQVKKSYAVSKNAQKGRPRRKTT